MYLLISTWYPIQIKLRGVRLLQVVEFVAVSQNPTDQCLCFSCHLWFGLEWKLISYFSLFPFLCASHFCIFPSLSDLPTMEKLRSHTSSEAQWKPSDTLHYVVLVPIKADTICCQELCDTLQKGNPPLLHPLPTGFKCFWMYIMLLQEVLYCQMTVQRLDLKSCPEGKCVLGVCELSLTPNWEMCVWNIPDDAKINCYF